MPKALCMMVDARSSVVVDVRSVDAGRRTIPQAILVGSSRDRVAIQRHAACEHGRANFASTI
ncbi:MAG: hypothetical protein ABW167_16780 [Baekduia sp.]